MRLRPYWKTLQNSFLKDMEYRVNYLILIFSTIITVIMELAIFRQLYEGRDIVGDLPKSAALSFVLLGSLLRSGSVIWSMVHEMIEQIREGAFRTYLLQPIHFPSYFFAQVIGPKMMTWTLSALTLIIVKNLPGFEPLLPASAVLPFVVAVILSYVLTWQTYLLFVYLGFWIEEATFLTVAFNLGVGIFSGSLIPLSWLPETLRQLIEFTPLPLLGDFPMRAGLNLLSTEAYLRYLVLSLLWIGCLALLNAWLWKRGTRAYEAYGG